MLDCSSYLKRLSQRHFSQDYSWGFGSGLFWMEYYYGTFKHWQIALVWSGTNFLRSWLGTLAEHRKKRWWRSTQTGRTSSWVEYRGGKTYSLRSVRALLSTSAGSMGLDVPRTRMVVICSAPSSAWEFSQEVRQFISQYPVLKTFIETFIFSLAALEGEASRQCVSSWGRKGRELLQSCGHIWNRTARLASRRGWWRFSHWEIPMVRLQ